MAAFCFRIDSPDFVKYAEDHGVSVNYLDYIASVYAIREGKSGEEMDAIMFGGGRKKGRREFEEYVRRRTDGSEFDVIPPMVRGAQGLRYGEMAKRGASGEEIVTNLPQVYSDSGIASQLTDMYYWYNRRSVDSISDGEMELLRLCFPVQHVMTDADGVERLVLMMPKFVEKPKVIGHTSEMRLIDGREGTSMEDYKLEYNPVWSEPAPETKWWAEDYYGTDAFRTVLANLDRMAKESVSRLLDGSGAEIGELNDLLRCNARQAAVYAQMYRRRMSDNRLQTPFRSRRRADGGTDVGVEVSDAMPGSRVRLTAGDRTYLACLMASHMSIIVDEMLDPETGAGARDYYLGDGAGDIDVRRMSRREFILDGRVGVRRLLAAVRDKVFDHNSGMSMDAALRLELFNRNFEENMRYASHKVIEYEGLTIEGLYAETPGIYDEIRDDDAITMSYYANGDTELWGKADTEVSTISRLPFKIRRFLATVEMTVTDEYGDEQAVMDRRGYGVRAVNDGTSALNTLYGLLGGCSTLEEMIDVLTEVGTPMCEATVRKIREDGQFASQFHRVFDQNRMYFGITEIRHGADGRMTYRNVTLNRDMVARRLEGDIQQRFLLGQTDLYEVEMNGAAGHGKVNRELLAEMRRGADELLRLVGSKTEFTDKEINDISRSVEWLLDSMGFENQGVDGEVVDELVFQRRRENVERPEDRDVYKVVLNIRNFLDHFDADSKNDILPFAGEETESGVAGNGCSAALKGICDLLVPHMRNRLEMMVDWRGSKRYVIARNTMMTDVMKFFDLSSPERIRRAMDYVDRNFNSVRFFNPTGDTRDIPDAMWWKSGLEHQMEFKENISFDGSEYGSMSGLAYLNNVLAEYFCHPERANGVASYAMSFGSRTLNGFVSQKYYKVEPMLYNGVTRRMSVEITAGLYHLALSDLIRMRGVFQHAGELAGLDADGNVVVYRNDAMTIDCTDAGVARKSYNHARRGRPGGEGLTDSDSTLSRDDIVKDGRIDPKIRKSGLVFRNLRFLNDEILNDTELGRKVIDYINGAEIDSEMTRMLEERIVGAMEERVESELGFMRDEKLFTRRAEYVNGVRVQNYTFLDMLIRESPEETLAMAIEEHGMNPITREPTDAAIGAYHEMRERLATDALSEFVWNDYFARSQSFMLTVGDPAQFGGTADLYKRMLGVTSPGGTSDPNAVDFAGRRVSDGKYRCIYISDKIITSAIRANVESLLDACEWRVQDELDSLRGMVETDHKAAARAAVLSRQLRSIRKKRREVPDLFKKVNATEGQSWTSPTGMRKKLYGFGSMEPAMERAFERIRSGEFTYDDVNVLFQVLKPILTTYEITKYNNGENAAMDYVRNFTYHKTAEVMLAMSGAVMDGDPSNNVLRAMHDFMEQSHWGGEGGKTYRTDGIDTILAVSSVKAGAHNVIDLSGCGTYDEAMAVLKAACYNEDNRYTDAVHVLPMREVRAQQENPDHFHDHEMGMPTQTRPQAMNDIETGAEYAVRGPDGKQVGMKGGDIARRYWDLLAANIKESVERKKLELGLTVRNEEGEIVPNPDVTDANAVLSGIMREHVERSSDYSPDFYYAVSLDENGEFNVPMDDFTTAIQFQNLLNSIVRNDVNYQKIAGGPVVQMSGFGLSKELSVRFAGADGRAVKTFAEYCRERVGRVPDMNAGLGGEALREREELEDGYRRDVLGMRYENGRWRGGRMHLDHIEAALNIPNSEMREALLIHGWDDIGRADPKRVGTYMTVDEALERGIITEEMLKGIAERVPVEDKYSMLPIRITRFMSNDSGELIILPDEVTLLTGCDFDVDKLFVMLKSFRQLRTISREDATALAERFVPKVGDPELDEEEIRRAVNVYYERGGGKRGKKFKAEDYSEAYERARAVVRKETLKRMGRKRAEDVRRIAGMIEKLAERRFVVTDEESRSLAEFFGREAEPYLKYRFEEERGDTHDGRNNEVFDLMWGVFTSEHNMDKLFNPGGFENVKKMTNVIKIMSLPDYAGRVREYGTYDRLMERPLSELEGILDAGEDYDPLAISTAVHFQRENVGGRRMVGWTANNASGHAFLSPLEIGVNPKLLSEYPNHPITSFWFGGRRLSDITLDQMVNDNGEYTSRVIGSFLAASVDSPKYETLSALNFNQFTGNAYMFMLRCGFDENAVMAFMSLPSIKELSRIWEVRSRENPYVRPQEVIREYKESHPEAFRRSSDGKDFVTFGGKQDFSDRRGVVFDIDQITRVYQGGKGAAFINFSAVDLFGEMCMLGDELCNISNLTKLNTKKGAIGSTLGDYYAQAQRIADYLEKYYDDSRITLFDPAKCRRIIDGNPVIREFHDAVFAPSGSTRGGSPVLTITEMLYSRTSPGFSPDFRSALALLENGKRGPLSAAQINEYMAAFTRYALHSAKDNTIFTTWRLAPDGETVIENYFTRMDSKGFIHDLRGYMRENDKAAPDSRNALLTALRLNAADADCPVVTVTVDRRGMSVSAQQELRDAWLDLYNEPSTKRLAVDLFAYSMQQNGALRSETSLDALVPARMKHDILEYTSGITRPHGPMEDFSANEFHIKYLRNKTHDRTLVPRYDPVDPGDVRFVRTGKVREVVFGEGADLSSLRRFVGKNTERYADVAVIDGEVCVLFEDVPGRPPVYKVTGRLGVPGRFLEMDPERSAIAESVFEPHRRRAARADVEYEPAPEDSGFADTEYRPVSNIEDSIDWSWDAGAEVMSLGERRALGEIVKGDAILKSVLDRITASGDDVRARQYDAIQRYMRGRKAELTPEDLDTYNRLMDRFCK